VPVHVVAARCGHDPAVLLRSYAKRTKKADTSAAAVIGALSQAFSTRMHLGPNWVQVRVLFPGACAKYLRSLAGVEGLPAMNNSNALGRCDNPGRPARARLIPIGLSHFSVLPALPACARSNGCPRPGIKVALVDLLWDAPRGNAPLHVFSRCYSLGDAMKTKAVGVHVQSPSPAERLRRHRNSRRSGVRCFTIRVTDAAVDAVVVEKYLEASERADKKAIQAAINIADELGALSGWRNDG
jgi:hypothetical protein